MGIALGGPGAMGGASGEPASAAVASTKPRDIATAETAANSVLPEGNSGIARRYPGDAGIAGDLAVLFAENFANGTVRDLSKRWQVIQPPDRVLATPMARISQQTEHRSLGARLQ